MLKQLVVLSAESCLVLFFACWWSQTGLNLLCTRFINHPFELFLPENPFITGSDVNLSF